MKENDLKEYITILADMEDNIYLQQTLIKNLKTHSMTLGNPRNIDKPAVPVQRVSHDRNDIGYGGVITFLIIGCLLCFWGIKLLISPSLLAFLPGIFLALAGGALALVGLVAIPNASKGKQQAQENASQFAAAMKNYEASINRYNQSLLDDKARIEKEKNEKVFIESEIHATESRLAQSEERLQEMYSIGVVYPKYRNMVMINSICEYLKSGRCSTLEGPSGAYNILENEMRLDRIILQLDQVIVKLDQIKQNQYMLYSAIEQGNKIAGEIAQSTKDLSTKLDSIRVHEQDYSQELHNLQATSSITAYNLERINKELHYMNRMKYYAGEYNGTFFNQLP